MSGIVLVADSFADFVMAMAIAVATAAVPVEDFKMLSLKSLS